MVVANPLVVFVIGLVSVIALLVWLKIPAFIGPIISGFIVGTATTEIASTEVPAELAEEFGGAMVDIGIPILMAAVIGKTMLESGVAERVVRGFQTLTGEERSYLALWGSSYTLSIPVFFDNVFYLLAPLARSLRARTGKDYALYITVVGAGASTTHSFIPPTPGPLAVAEQIGVDLGVTIFIGIIVAIPAALVAGVLYGLWINQRIEIPLREAMSTTSDEIEELANRSTERLPGLFEASLPIVLAVVLIAADTTADTIVPGTTVADVATYVGDPNFALTAAALAAALTYLRVRALDRDTWSDELVESLKSGGHIAAITSAGAAFGGMLAASGIGDYIASIFAGLGLSLLVSAYVIAATIRIAQGSATVAMLTAGGIVAPLTDQLAAHPVYLVMVIGAGGTIFSWFNDSGFWVVKEIGGLTQTETLQIWTVLSTLISVTAFVVVIIMSNILPLA